MLSKADEEHLSTHSCGKSISIRTYDDWKKPPPGCFEMDMVAHCGHSVAGNHIQSLVLTDIASGWTEAAALIVREQILVTMTIDEIPDARIGCG